MIDSDRSRGDDAIVLTAALKAVFLISAGLGLMVWDDHREAKVPIPLTVVSALNAP